MRGRLRLSASSRGGLFRLGERAGVHQRDPQRGHPRRAANAVVDFQLKPGEISTTVEVSAASPLLQTQDASVGQVFTSQEIDTLPLNGRNYTLLAQLTTGATTPVAETRGLSASGSFVANGVPSIYNTYILDGITNNNNTVDFLNGAACTW